MSVATKTITVVFDELRNEDRLLAYGLSAGEGTTINLKPLKAPLTLVSNAVCPKTATTKRERLPLLDADGNRADRGFPRGTHYRVQRVLTTVEIVEREAESVRRAAQAVREAIKDPAEGILRARDGFIEAMKETNDPADVIRWKADTLAEAQGQAECWIYVSRYEAHLAKEAGGSDADGLVLRAVVGTVKEMQDQMLRYRPSRSTNPYANAVEEDKRAGVAAWLRDYRVLHALSAARTFGCAPEQDEV